jgi:hypothetical protein
VTSANWTSLCSAEHTMLAQSEREPNAAARLSDTFCNGAHLVGILSFQ